MVDLFEGYLDLVTAAAVLDIHPQSVRRLILHRRIPATKFAGKYLIERVVLEQFARGYDPRPGRKQYPGLFTWDLLGRAR